LGGIGIFMVSCSHGPGGSAYAPPPSADTTIMPWNVPTAQKQEVSKVVTAGNRSGDGAINRNSIDALLNKKASARPGLATGWGKEMSSPMGYTGFVRSSGKPTGGISMIRYNDSEGAAAMGASSHLRGGTMQKAANGLIEWGVKGRWGKLANRFWKGSRMVIGKKGQRYSLLVKNLSRSRLEAVMSVDGLDVIDGKSASVRKRGYIVQPGKTLEVKGFRTSHEAVAAFKFSSVPNSYANMRHGETRNVGVMGLAIFTEKGVNPWGRNVREVERRGGARAFADAPIYRAQD